MTWVIIGLGNPGEEYEGTRHNAGRMAVMDFAKRNGFSEWKRDGKSESLVARGTIGSAAVVCILPETFMNKSGKSAAYFVKTVKAAEKCVVVYDELDMALGSAKMSFNRGSGGHKGIESIARALKTKAFWRVRLGISPATASGKIRKPKGEDEVMEFILKKFKESDLVALKRVFKRTSEALAAIVVDGPMNAMNAFNTAS